MTDPKVGDRVRFDWRFVAWNSPEVEGRLGTITEVLGPIGGRGDPFLVSLRIDGEHRDRTGIAAALLTRA